MSVPEARAVCYKETFPQKTIHQGIVMKLQLKHTNQATPAIAGLLAMVVLLIFSSCATQTSNLGKIAPPKEVLPLVNNDGTEERIWQSKDVEVAFQTIKIGDSFTIEGMLSVNDSVTRTFPTMKWLKFSINYLDENNKVISTHPVKIRTGYRNTEAKNLKLIDTAAAPQDAVAFVFSYWGLMTSPGVRDENPGDWEIYHNPFSQKAENQNSTENGLFYAD